MSKSLLGKFLFVLMLAFVLLIAACSDGSDDDSSSDEEGNEESSENEGEDEEEEEASGEGDQLYSIEDFSPTTANSGEPIEGGELTYGLVTDTAFEGTLNWAFYSGTYDAEILNWFDESLLGYSNEYRINDEGAATYEVDEENSSITFTIKDGVKWHDGEPVTAEDWAFAYETILHPDYDGVRGTSAGFTRLLGYEEYVSGEADEIEGIEIVDDQTITFHYDRLTPSLLTGGIWGYPLAKHIFEDIPVAEMSSSPEVREEPIGFGPFKVESVTPGESVTLSKFEDYWRGEPNLDKVTIKTINPSTAANAVETGEVDLVDSFPADQYADNADLEGVDWLGMIDQAYTYIGFKLGDWDAEAGKVNYKPEEMKMGDVDLRRAMWYAVDNSEVGEQFYDGLRWNGTTLIPPSHPEYHDDSIETPTFDPDKANQILDDAGYEDVDGDGFREDPDGEELVINFATMSGGDVAQPLANYYMQSWERVGLNVELVDGRLLEFNSFYDRVGQRGEDDPEIDIYQGAWSVGYDVDPTGLYGKEALFNFPRYESEKNDELLAEGVSEEAFDTEYRKEVYSEWQEFMVEEIPVFPTLYRSIVVPANERVVNWDITVEGTNTRYSEVGVTE
ncbi:oligopeptide ABC transporter substrate-binding protein [Piscibacillus halophilus]|uniref:Peptide/nickel transport system substrate-binding protein n=1 Tax=Piscibacillus halophilus TaxID=571933 RepID=A0A1H9E850_9BACI|nr:oligopeptide ABC transporter substrate-binding protein [Piscibacillus halophilus]SEQ21078.1 peptide/nickel transport system substrate-binding protein [Piscibacillus halophilus]